MYSPPSGITDCETDAELDEQARKVIPISAAYHRIEVPEVGVIHARRPLPNAVPTLANTVNAKISGEARADAIDRFVQNHLAPGEFKDLLSRMVDPDEDLPPDALHKVSQAIATAGTARPTRRSSASR